LSWRERDHWRTTVWMQDLVLCSKPHSDHWSTTVWMQDLVLCSKAHCDHLARMLRHKAARVPIIVFQWGGETPKVPTAMKEKSAVCS